MAAAQTATKKGTRLFAWLFTFIVALSVCGLGIGAQQAWAAAGDTPPHTKNIHNNGDGTYTISLDVVGDSEKKPNNINVIVVVDTSGSMTQQRMTAAKNAVNSLANSLYAYNTSSEPNTVEMALVRFATSSSVAQQPTNNATTFRNAVNGLGNAGNGGTNWESALQTANGVDFGDDDQTFAVFVSDGNPTFRTTQNGWNDWSYQYQQWGTGQETTQNIQRCYTTAVDDAEALATKVTPANFFTIGAFGNVDRMEQLTDDAGSDSSTNYYSAQDTAALNQAIADILAKIEMAGIGSTEIDDGTTNQVTTSSGEVAELLEVDTSSFKYYRSGGSYGTNQPWTDAPAAEFKNGTVEWDLASQGLLENGVRYTVTFDCYPSQETYDTIAKLKNGDITYDSLDPEIKKYIVDNGGGSYSLRTNTNAELSWDDTRDDAGQQTAGYENPDPVATDAETLTATKVWEGGDADTDSLEMTVLMDDDPFHTATMTKNDGWTTSSFISIGIIKNGKVLPGAEGHDFTFAELDDTQYHWELESPVVHPMLIDGTKTMLIKVDEDHQAPSGAQTYTINGATYYVDTETTGLTATNHRRSNLNLTKEVTGEDAPADAKFPFALTVNNPKAPATAPSDTDDPEHESDYWIWLSIRDENGQGVTGLDLGDGVVEDSGGYYYAPNGTTFNAEIGAGWSLRFLNLPTGTTYTFAETLAENFAFVKSELIAGEDSTFKGAQTTTGTIENTKTSYAVKYTNDYQLTDLEITKVWKDNKNQDGIRLTADQLKDKLTLSPKVEGAEPTVKDNGDDTYTITYKDLPRFNNGQEVEYTVTESAIDGYTTEGSPAKDHGTITNTHEPKVTTLKVTKVWEDNDNVANTRPESISVQLIADGKASGDPVTISGDEWTYTWKSLPVNANGKKIEYGVEEVKVDDYTTTMGKLSGDADNGYEITITNSNVTIDTDDVTVDFFKKTVGVANPTKAATFNFTIKAEDGAPAPANKSGKAEYAAGAGGDVKVGFGKITFTEEGTYTYTITEDKPAAGWTAESYTATVTVEVSKNDNGKLIANVTDGSITNNYASEGTAVLEATKAIEGAAWPAGKKITFTLAGEGGTLPETKTVELTEPGKATFGAIKYTQDDAGKEYTYTISEDGFGTGWTGSGNVTATVKVTDNGDGTLKTDVTYSPENATIKNTYAASGSAEIKVDKVLTGRDWLDGEKFTFTLKGSDGAEIESVDVTKDSPTAEFAPIAYKESDAGKTYTYTVTETSTLPGGITKSKDVTVTVKVSDNGDGTLKTDVTYDNDATITNTYEAEGEAVLEATKELVGRDWLEGETYTFTLKDSEGNVIDEQEVSSNSTVSFEAIEYDESDAGQTYTYTISETSTLPGGVTKSADITATVTVTDNGDGTLKTEVTYTNDDTIVNTYKATGEVSFPVKKVLSVPEGFQGPEEWEYTIDVTANDGAPETETMSGKVNQENDTVTFGPFEFTEADAGKTYTYTVKETGEVAGVTNDEDAAKGKTVTVNVKDNGDGTLNVTADSTDEKPLTFTNTYKADSTEATPEAEKSVTYFPIVYLYDEDANTGQFKFEIASDNGAPLPESAEATNDAEGHVSFGAIEYTKPGEYKYTITEKNDGQPGITYDETKIGLTVTVVDNRKGKLEVKSAIYDKEDRKFTNTYEATGDVPVTAMKKLKSTVTGNTLAVDEGQFTFEVSAVTDGAPMPENTTASNDASGKVDFGKIDFTASKIAEDAWTYTNKKDEESSSSTSDEGADDEGVEGQSEAAEAADEAATDEAAAEAADEAVTDEAAADAEATAEAADEAATDEAAAEAADEAVTDEAAAEATDEAAGEMTEQSEPSGEITLAEAGASSSATAEEEADEAAADAEAADEAAPAADAAEANDEAATDEAAADEAATDEADAELTAQAEDKVLRTATFEYKIKEVAGDDSHYTYDGSEATVTVTVTDNGKGELTATADYSGNKGEFTNEYTPDPVKVDPPVCKVIEGNDDLYNGGDFTFTIKNTAAPKGVEAPMPDRTEITNSAEYEFEGMEGYYEFGWITFTQPGTYEYTVTESGSVENVKNDSKSSKTFTFTVKEDAKGNLSITPDTDDACWTFTNVYSEPENNPAIKVVKKVVSEPENGKYYKKGETIKYEITVTNTGDVDLVDVTVTDELTADEWTLDGLAVGESKTFKTSYEVTADDVDAGEVLNEVTATGYDPDGNEVTDDDDVTVPTGKVKKPVPPNPIPRTGDMAPILGLLIAAIVAGVVLIGAARKRSTKR